MEYKKLDDKIKDLKSTRVFKKVTPKYDLSWYVKWLSSVLILTAVCFRAAGGFHMFDLYFSRNNRLVVGRNTMARQSINYVKWCFSNFTINRHI